MTPAELEARVMAALDLPAYPIAGQTYPRKQDWQVLSALAGIAGSLYKFAFDLRLLQSPVIDEWHEPFGKQQVGSSAMPFKRNPINAEKIDSLGRLVVAMERVAWDNASHSLLERTLDDSANRREIAAGRLPRHRRDDPRHRPHRRRPAHRRAGGGAQSRPLRRRSRRSSAC